MSKKKEEIRHAQILTKMKGEKFSNYEDRQNVSEKFEGENQNERI